MGIGTIKTTPLFEDGTAPRILITDFDRIEAVDAGIYRYVATVNGTNCGEPERRVIAYLDVTFAGIAAGVQLSFLNIKRLASGLWVPALKLGDTYH